MTSREEEKDKTIELMVQALGGKVLRRTPSATRAEVATNTNGTKETPPKRADKSKN